MVDSVPSNFIRARVDKVAYMRISVALIQMNFLFYFVDLN